MKTNSILKCLFFKPFNPTSEVFNMSFYLATMASMAIALNFAAHPSRAVAQGYVGQQHTSRDSLILSATHDKNKRPSNQEKHDHGIKAKTINEKARNEKNAKKKDRKFGKANNNGPAGGRNGSTSRPK
jgi:hypothetical protein